jgi:Fe2+ or Zn2+ uptake regulation protein
MSASPDDVRDTAIARLHGVGQRLTANRAALVLENVPASAGLERSVAAAAAAITRSTGFRTQRHRVDLVGLCRKCA